ncbi:family 55 glycoside hydrolase [Ophiobolus disseminans]|uniref:Family 55 glycoside hydrolase n=1 Tax=Ophiobolus disseminans TaxID=1469910 RepID=A0A6A7AC03_9PLEO|nr:family 55 glycoside hydrolase [Ophiobolus disseminans]
MKLHTALAPFALTAVVSSQSKSLESIVSGSTYWYANILHNGIAPTNPSSNYTIFRNVLDYGAVGDGKTDSTLAIQNAINSGSRNAGTRGSTGQPAVVFFPPGTYVVSAPLQNYIGTVLMGDPIVRPSLKASATFQGSTVMKGVDPKYPGLVAFYHEIKNLVIDSTAVAAHTKLVLLDWSVSQACQLSNSAFVMPVGSAHTGVASTGQNSPLLINDMEITGGATGWTGASTQFHLKNVAFRNVTTGVRPTNTVQMSIQGCRFEGVGTGVDMSGGTLGMLNMFDATAVSTQALVLADAAQTTSQGSIVLENVAVDGSVVATVKAGSTTLLAGSIVPGNAWIRGNMYNGTASSATPQKASGQKIASMRPAALVSATGSFHTTRAPTYANFSSEQVVNVKDVASHRVYGDGKTDDTIALQTILNSAAQDGKIAYFPHGTYLLTDTLIIPPNSRLWGESFTELSGSGAAFKDAAKPKPIIQIGRPDSTGIAQFTDFVFTVAEPLPGAILVEVNMAGPRPGDVGFFNTHFRIGGARGTKTNECATIELCKAVHIAAHLTKSSSSYWENSWAWTADHDLDGGGFGSYPSPAGGFLIEAQKGTWMLGWGVEHFVLYQVTINSASNIFVGLQQGEAAYYQGTGNTLLAPAPWTSNLLPSDPSFSWCAASAVSCRMSLYQRVVNSTDISLYSGGYWNFVAGPDRTFCSKDCQDNAVLYENNKRLVAYGVSTINNANLVVESGPGGSRYKVAVPHKGNEAAKKDVFDSAVVAAYLRQSA